VTSVGTVFTVQLVGSSIITTHFSRKSIGKGRNERKEHVQEGVRGWCGGEDVDDWLPISSIGEKKASVKQQEELPIPCRLF